MRERGRKGERESGMKSQRLSLEMALMRKPFSPSSPTLSLHVPSEGVEELN